MPAAYDKLVPSLKSLLPDKAVDNLGREVSFIRRLRAIRASVFVWSVVLSRFSAGRPGFTQARHWYERLCGRRFCPRPFQMRFKAAQAVELFEKAFETAVRPWLDPRKRRPKSKLAKHFADIIAIDSTLVKVADCLRSTYTGSRNTTAAIKLCVAVSLYGLLPLWARVVGANVHDMVLFPSLSMFRKRTLFLMDRGFGKHDQFDQIDCAGQFYVCPQRRNGVARIVSLRSGSAKLRRALRKGPVQLRSILPKEKRTRLVWDLDVEIRRAGDSRFENPITARLIIFPGPGGEQRGYLTNLPHQSWTPSAVRELYRLRWQIELVFKELKQDLALRSMPSKDPNAVKVFAWASLIALALSRTVSHWLEPDLRAVGLKRSIRPALVSRALRGSVHLLAHLLRHPRKIAVSLLHLLRQMILTEVSVSSPQRDDSFARLDRLLEAA